MQSSSQLQECCSSVSHWVKDAFLQHTFNTRKIASIQNESAQRKNSVAGSNWQLIFFVFAIFSDNLKLYKLYVLNSYLWILVFFTDRSFKKKVVKYIHTLCKPKWSGKYIIPWHLLLFIMVVHMYWHLSFGCDIFKTEITEFTAKFRSLIRRVYWENFPFSWPKISEFTAKFGPSFDQKYRSSLRNLCLQNNKHIRGHCKTFTNWYLTANNVCIVQGHWSVQILNQ